MTDTNKFIDEMYQLWLYHARYLYDFCTTHVLEYPSHTVAWLGDSRRQLPLRDYAVAQLATGTVKGGTNYVSVHHVFLHAQSDDVEEYDDDELKAFHGYQGRYSEVAALMQRHSRFVHDGPVTKLAPMPQRPHVLAVRGRGANLSVVDIARRRAEPEDETIKPDMHLKGHKREGYAMEWSPQEEGWLATGSADQAVNVYSLMQDVELCGTRPTVDLAPATQLIGHTDAVEGVTWHGQHTTVLASCGLDKTVRVWDLRTGTSPTQTETLHREGIHGLEFHPTGQFVLATCSADKSVRVWDMRKWDAPVCELAGHTGAIMGVRWAPFNDSVLLSYGADRHVLCWDISKIGQAHEGDDEHAPPEMVFKHAGHTAHVREAAWAPFNEDEWTVASVDDNNMLMVWSPADDIFNDEVNAENYNAHDSM